MHLAENTLIVTTVSHLSRQEGGEGEKGDITHICTYTTLRKDQ